MKTPRMSDERGIALAVAVLALVVIGALVAGSFYAGRVEQRGGQNALYAAQAFEAAEAGLTTTIDNWPAALNTRAVAVDSVFPVASFGGGNEVTVTVTRLSATTSMIRSEGVHRDAGGGLMSRGVVSTLAKYVTSSIPIRAALVSRGSLTVSGTADIYGANANPPGWGTTTAARTACPADATTVPAAEVSGSVSTNGHPDIIPAAVQHSTALTDSMFLTPFDQLRAAATIVLSSGTTSLSPSPSTTGSPAVCNRTLASNWGEPTATVPLCGSYFPIIYAPGDLSLNNGRGQGILLVEGDLHVAGNFTFAGIVITKGAFDASHGTNNIYGTVLSSNAALDDITMAGTPQVQFSTCAVSRALTSSARVVPFGQRSWSQVY